MRYLLLAFALLLTTAVTANADFYVYAFDANDVYIDVPGYERTVTPDGHSSSTSTIDLGATIQAAYDGAVDPGSSPSEDKPDTLYLAEPPSLSYSVIAGVGEAAFGDFLGGQTVVLGPKNTRITINYVGVSPGALYMISLPSTKNAVFQWLNFDTPGANGGQSGGSGSYFYYLFNFNQVVTASAAAAHYVKDCNLSGFNGYFWDLAGATGGYVQMYAQRVGITEHRWGASPFAAAVYSQSAYGDIYLTDVSYDMSAYEWTTASNVGHFAHTRAGGFISMDNCHVIGPPQGSSAEFTLVRLRGGTNHVIKNSTFALTGGTGAGASSCIMIGDFGTDTSDEAVDGTMIHGNSFGASGTFTGAKWGVNIEGYGTNLYSTDTRIVGNTFSDLDIGLYAELGAINTSVELNKFYVCEEGIYASGSRNGSFTSNVFNYCTQAYSWGLSGFSYNNRFSGNLIMNGTRVSDYDPAVDANDTLSVEMNSISLNVTTWTRTFGVNPTALATLQAETFGDTVVQDPAGVYGVRPTNGDGCYENPDWWDRVVTATRPYPRTFR